MLKVGEAWLVSKYGLEQDTTTIASMEHIVCHINVVMPSQKIHENITRHLFSYLTSILLEHIVTFRWKLALLSLKVETRFLSEYFHFIAFQLCLTTPRSKIVQVVIYFSRDWVTSGRWHNNTWQADTDFYVLGAYCKNACVYSHLHYSQKLIGWSVTWKPWG